MVAIAENNVGIDRKIIEVGKIEKILFLNKNKRKRNRMEIETENWKII